MSPLQQNMNPQKTGNWWSGYNEQVPTKTGGQMNFLQQILGMLSGGGGVGQGMNQGLEYLMKILSGDTSEFEAPLMRQFNEQIVPGIAERFSGMGAGAQSSSAFGQQLGSAGAGLTESLGALRGGMRGQAAGALSSLYQNLAGLGLGTNAFENVYKPGFGQGISQGIGQGIGMLPSLFF